MIENMSERLYFFKRKCEMDFFTLKMQLFHADKIKILHRIFNLRFQRCNYLIINNVLKAILLYSNMPPFDG